MHESSRTFFLGCAVWAYKDWVGEFFPIGTRSSDFLHAYSRRLTTVEGNTTFYAIPSPATVQRWVQETPADFQFCLKLPKDISHAGPLVNHLGETRAFTERMAALGTRLGPFFLQLPPSYHPRQLSDLAAWLAAWPPAYRLAVEVRHADWWAEAYEHALMQLLDHYGVGRVIMDVRPLELGDLPGAEADLQKARDNKPDVPMHPLTSGGMAMVRYIGHPDIQRNGQLLDEWADRIAAWITAGTQVYFFMHCPVETYSPQLCRMLNERLRGRPGIGQLPWDSIGGDPGLTQASLFE